jgi:DeoR/GlpR family transcriptional regulator of sugar metabolism
VAIFLKTITIRSILELRTMKNARQRNILAILQNESFLSVRELSMRLFASQPTIRRDLDFLEKNGYVRRSHGGVTAADGRVNTPVPFRRGIMTKEKTAICELAATLLQPEQLIFIDASTTAFFLSHFLRREQKITVVTNGITLCRTLSEKQVQVFSTGGRPIRESEAFVGSIAERTVGGFFADWMFFSPSSLDQGGVISDYSEEETSLRLAMRQRAEKIVFLCDSKKFASRSAFEVLSLREIDYFITDQPIPQDLASACGLSVTVQGKGALMYQRA